MSHTEVISQSAGGQLMRLPLVCYNPKDLPISQPLYHKEPNRVEPPQRIDNTAIYSRNARFWALKTYILGAKSTL